MMNHAMHSTAVKTASPADEAAIVNVLALAFSADPMARWTFSEPHRFIDTSRRFIPAFAGKAFASGTAYYVDGYLGAALWLPPGVHPDDEQVLPLLEAAIPAQRRSAVLSVFEEMERYHPGEPHWYLPIIGIDPTQQGRGLGSLLMQHALQACDRDGVPAYLESSNPRNIPFYERHGFEVIGTIQVDDSPQLVPMLRQPRQPG